MTAGGSHFHGTLHVLLSAHVGEIEIEIRLLFVEFAPRVNPRWFKFCRAVDESDYIGKTVHAIHVDIVHHRRLTDVLARHDESLELLFPGTDGYGQGTAYGLQLPSRPSSPTNMYLSRFSVSTFSMAARIPIANGRS